eukprot:scaffold16717_cov53-Attheya_sp.AAC.13
MNNSDQYVGADWVILSNALVTLSVLFTYPLQLFPCIGLVAKIVQTRSLSDDSRGVGVNRDFIPLDTDETVNERHEDPATEDLQDLDGAFAGSSTALIIPPLIDLKFVLQSNRKTSLAAIKCYILLIIGLVFGIIGTSASVVDIYKRETVVVFVVVLCSASGTEQGQPTLRMPRQENEEIGYCNCSRSSL